MAKLLGYKKKATAIFAKVKHLVQSFQIAITDYKTIWDSIMFDVAFDLLHDNFKMRTASFFSLDNKDLEKI